LSTHFPVTIVNINGETKPALFRFATFLELPEFLTKLSHNIKQQNHELHEIHASDKSILVMIVASTNDWANGGIHESCVVMEGGVVD
jgi:hypothetical protein